MNHPNVCGRPTKENFFGPFLASIPAFVTQVIAGILEGHAAVLVPQLTNSRSPALVTRDDTPWTVSLGFVLTPFFAVVGKPLMDTFGRKCNMYLFFMFSTFGFLSVSVASAPAHVYIGRVLSSAAYGLSSCAFSYTAEICAERQRPNFIFVLSLMRSLGLLIVYCMGVILPWNVGAMVFAVTSHIFLLYVFHIPQSPAWLVKQGRLEEAATSLKWLRNDFDTIEREITTLKTTAPDDEFLQRSGLAAFFNPTISKPFLALVVYAFLQQATGVPAILSYAQDFFGALHSSYDAKYILICVAFYRILVTALWVYAFNKYDKLFLTTCAAFGASCMLLATVVWHVAYPDAVGRNESFQLISISLCASYVLVGSGIDVQNLPIDLRTVFPQNVLGAARGGVKFFSYFFLFLSVLFYPFLFRLLGLTWVLFLFGASSFAFGLLIMSGLPKFTGKIAESTKGGHTTKLQLTTYL